MYEGWQAHADTEPRAWTGHGATVALDMLRPVDTLTGRRVSTLAGVTGLKAACPLGKVVVKPRDNNGAVCVILIIKGETGRYEAAGRAVGK